MTTNQTIDGVPRALLQSLYTDTLQQWGVGGNAAGQLRALLDAPAVQWLAMEVNGKPWVIKEGPNAHKWRAMGYDLFPVQPAAQPQGEPVAWLAQAIGKDGEVYRKTASPTEITLRDVGFAWGQGVIDRFTVVIKPLYAEQPAPVAEQLIERLAQRFPDLENMYTAEVFADWLRNELIRK